MAIRTKKVNVRLHKALDDITVSEQLGEPLTDARKEKFCLELFSGCSGAEAARRAGYTNKQSRFRASGLLKNHDVRCRLAFLFRGAADRCQMQKDEVLRLLCDRARVTYADVGQYIGMRKEDFCAAIKRDPRSCCIKEVRYRVNREGDLVVDEIKIYDARETLGDIVAILGYKASDKLEVAGNVGIVYLPQPTRVSDNG